MIGTSTRSILRATPTISLLVLQHFSVVLNTLRAFGLILNQGELLSLKGKRLLLALQLKLLAFAHFLQRAHYSQNFILVHGVSDRKKQRYGNFWDSEIRLSTCSSHRQVAASLSDHGDNHTISNGY